MGMVTYDPSRVDVVVDNFVLSGFADEMISFKPNSPVYKTYKGINGYNTRAYTEDLSGIITITLQSSSDSNDYLSGLLIESRKSPENFVIEDLLIKDRTGTTMIKGLWGHLSCDSFSLGKTIGKTTWTIDVPLVQYFAGGNF